MGPRSYGDKGKKEERAGPGEREWHDPKEEA